MLLLLLLLSEVGVCCDRGMENAEVGDCEEIDGDDKLFREVRGVGEEVSMFPSLRSVDIFTEASFDGCCCCLAIDFLNLSTSLRLITGNSTIVRLSDIVLLLWTFVASGISYNQQESQKVSKKRDRFSVLSFFRSLTPVD
jgi:hypothetical protein